MILGHVAQLHDVIPLTYKNHVGPRPSWDSPLFLLRSSVGADTGPYIGYYLSCSELPWISIRLHGSSGREAAAGAADTQMKQPLAADDVDGSPGGDEEPEAAILR